MEIPLCIICYEYNKCFVLKCCKQTVCKECLGTWCLQHKYTCPVCKKDLDTLFIINLSMKQLCVLFVRDIFTNMLWIIWFISIIVIGIRWTFFYV